MEGENTGENQEPLNKKKVKDILQEHVHGIGDSLMSKVIKVASTMTKDDAGLNEPLLLENFSYLALLRGDLDVCYSSGIAHMQGNAQTLSSSANDDNTCRAATDKSQNVLGGTSQVETFIFQGEGNQYSSCVKSSMDNEGSYVNSTYRYLEQDRNQQSSTGQEDNPWDSTLFDNMQLDEVVEEDDNEDAANHKDFDHTWNLRAKNCNTGQDDDTRKKNSESSAEIEDNEKKNITEEDVELFLQDEEQGIAQSTEQGTEQATEQGDSTVSADLMPEKGMEFKSREEAQNFLNMYSFAAGFSIAVVSVYRTTSKKRNNEITRATIKCSKHGHNTDAETEQVVAQRQTTVFQRTDCKVEMVINEKKGIWRITNLMLEHNHPLEPGGRFFRSHVHMTKEEKAIIRVMKQCNIPTRNIVSVLAHLRGGMEQLPYNKRKVCNYGSSVNRELKNSDLMEVLAWFNKKQAEEPGFYYSMELDGDNKVRSIFWSDARARQYYDLYGDCICFDTTFLTNKYNLPFAPFVGISPHGKTYIFACAFIINETANTFEWLFRVFLTAMGGKHPQSIMTDQCQSIGSAIDRVFKNATHRNCLFHVKKNCDDKNGPTFAENEGLYEEMQDIIDNSLTVEEFETLWQQMIEKYNVGDVKVFQDMWKNRKKYVPVYFKTKFFPFIQTTARSEGTNALFKKGVGAQFSMTSFLREYQRIMDTIHANEDELDHKVANKKVQPTKFLTKYYIERQAHDLYNLAIFRKFQQTLKDVTRLHLREQEKEKIYVLFQANNYAVKEHRQRNYIVLVNLQEQEYSCVCCKFEKDGILCSHILKVMLHLEVDKIPEKYIIDRWRKKKEKLNYKLPAPEEIDNDSLRYSLLTRILVQTASKGSKSREKCQYLIQEAKRIEDHMDAMDKVTEETGETQSTAGPTSTRTVSNLFNASLHEGSSATIDLLNPDHARTRGRPRMLTIKEKIKQNKFYKCSHCDSKEHTFKNCTNKHLVFNLPKPKRNRKSKAAGAGTNSPAKKSAKKGKKTNDAAQLIQEIQVEKIQNTCSGEASMSSVAN